MKKLGTLVSILFLILSCSKNESTLTPVDLGQNSLAGTWQLTHTYISPGGETDWQPVENGPKYTYMANGNFTISEGNCISGTYKLEENILELHCAENSEVRKFHINKLAADEMEISFLGCIEACIYRFRKQ